MKAKFLIIIPVLMLVTALCTILIDGQRDTRDHVLKVTPQSGSPEPASPVLDEATVSDSGSGLQQNGIRVAIVKTDEAELRERGFGWLLDDGSTGFGRRGWSEGSDSLNFKP